MLLPEHTKHVKHLVNLLTKVWKGINCQLNTARGKYWNVVFNLAAVSVIAVLCFMQQKQFFFTCRNFLTNQPMWSLKWGKSKSECKWQLFAHSFFHWSSSPPVKYTDCESWWCWISLHEALTAWGWDSNWAWMGSSCTFVEVSPSPTTSRYLTLWGGRRPLGSAKTAATASQCAYPEPVHWLRTMSLLVTPNLFIIIAGLS